MQISQILTCHTIPSSLWYVFHKLDWGRHEIYDVETMIIAQIRAIQSGNYNRRNMKTTMKKGPTEAKCGLIWWKGIRIQISRPYDCVEK